MAFQAAGLKYIGMRNEQVSELILFFNNTNKPSLFSHYNLPPSHYTLAIVVVIIVFIFTYVL